MMDKPSSESPERILKEFINICQINNMDEHTHRTYRFGPFLLEPTQRRLTQENGVPVEMTVKAFDVLLCLVARPKQLVTREEILDRVWQGAQVEESNLTTTISMIRKALAETEQHRYIETVPKKGYRLVADVAVEDSQPEHGTASTGAPKKRYWLGGLAVLILIGVAVGVWRYRRAPSQTADDLYNYAVELEQQGNDELALETLTQALYMKPDFDEANVKAGWISYQDNQNDAAVKYVLAVAHKPVSAATETAHGRCTRLKAEGIELLVRGDQEGASRKFQLAIDTEPTDADALYYLSDLATEMGRLEVADHALTKCQHTHTANPFCTFQLVEVRLYQNRYEDAIAESERASKQGLRYPWLDKPLGYAKLAQGDINGALAHFRALEDSGRRLGSNVYFRVSQEGIASIALYQGRVEDARRQIIAATETSSSRYDSASYYLFLAQIDALHHRIRDSREEVRQAEALSQSDDLAVTAIKAFAMSGDYPSARVLLRSHREAAANLGTSYVAAEQFVTGVEEVGKRDLNRGIRALADAHRLDSDPVIAYYLARALMQSGEWQQATETLNTILSAKGAVLVDSITSLLPLAEYSLGLCYERLGNPQLAASHSDEALRMWSHADPDLKSVLEHPTSRTFDVF
jgi:DNA-binding winged helix-turn-helix (wHTH) protein/Flp pilus assembly protein TadD